MIGGSNAPCTTPSLPHRASPSQTLPVQEDADLLAETQSLQVRGLYLLGLFACLGLALAPAPESAQPV